MFKQNMVYVMEYQKGCDCSRISILRYQDFSKNLQDSQESTALFTHARQHVHTLHTKKIMTKLFSNENCLDLKPANHISCTEWKRYLQTTAQAIQYVFNSYKNNVLCLGSSAKKLYSFYAHPTNKVAYIFIEEIDPSSLTESGDVVLRDVIKVTSDKASIVNQMVASCDSDRINIEFNYKKYFHKCTGFSPTLEYYSYPSNNISKIHSHALIFEKSDGNGEDIVDHYKNNSSASVPTELILSLYQQILKAIATMHKQKHIHCNISLQSIYFQGDCTREYQEKISFFLDDFIYTTELSDFKSTLQNKELHDHYFEDPVLLAHLFNSEEKCIDLRLVEKIDIFAFGIVMSQLFLLKRKNSAAEKVATLFSTDHAPNVVNHLIEIIASECKYTRILLEQERSACDQDPLRSHMIKMTLLMLDENIEKRPTAYEFKALLREKLIELNCDDDMKNCEIQFVDLDLEEK